MAYCTMRPSSQAPWLPAGRCGFNRILGTCPTHLLSGGSVPTERNVTLKLKINFKKIQRRYSSSCSTSHCSHSESRGQHSRHCSNCPAQATEETARLALQVRYLFIRGKPLCQAVACHSPLVPFGETPETINQYVNDQP